MGLGVETALGLVVDVASIVRAGSDVGRIVTEVVDVGSDTSGSGLAVGC